MVVLYLDTRCIEASALLEMLRAVDVAQSAASEVVQRPLTVAQTKGVSFPSVFQRVSADAHTFGQASSRAKPGTMRSASGAPAQCRHFWKSFNHILERGPRLFSSHMSLDVETRQWLYNRIRFSNAEEAKVTSQRLGLRRMQQQSNMKELLMANWERYKIPWHLAG